MSKTNENKPDSSTSSSTIKNLFRQTEQTLSDEQEEPKTKEKEPIGRFIQQHEEEPFEMDEFSEQTERRVSGAAYYGQSSSRENGKESRSAAPKSRSGKSFFSRVKSGWSRMLESMKQQPEAEDFKDDLFDEEEQDAHTAVKETEAKAQTAESGERKGFFKNLYIENFETAIEEKASRTVEDTSEQDPSQKITKNNEPYSQTDTAAKDIGKTVKFTAPKALIVSSDDTETDLTVKNTDKIQKQDVGAVLDQTPEHHTETKDAEQRSNTAQSKAEQEKEHSKAEYSNVIYTAPSQTKAAQKTTAPVAAPPPSKPTRSEKFEFPTELRLGKELPVFDIFAEYDKEQKMKESEKAAACVQQTVESVPSETAETKTALSEQKKEDKPLSPAPAAEENTSKESFDSGEQKVKAEAAEEDKTETSVQNAEEKKSVQSLPLQKDASSSEVTVEKTAETVQDKAEQPPVTKTADSSETENGKISAAVQDNSENTKQADRQESDAAAQHPKETPAAVKADLIKKAEPQTPPETEKKPIELFSVKEETKASAHSEHTGSNEPKRNVSDNLIYDAPAVSTSRREEEKDLTEGKNTAIVYHYSKTPPMIVMAGKFTGTLRAEYEAAREYRNRLTGIGEGNKTAAEKTLRPEDILSKTKSENVKKASEQTSGVIFKKKKNKQASKDIIAAKKNDVKQEKKKKDIPLIDLEQYEEIPERPVRKAPSAFSKKGTSRFDKQKNAKEKKQRKKGWIRSLFSSEDAFDPDDLKTREYEAKAQIEDYNEEKDAEAIKTEISTNFQSVFVRVIILLCTTVASIILGLLGQCTELFRVNIRNGWLWFSIISFLLLTTAIIASRNPIVNGILPLKRFKGNSDTAVAIASAAAAMQSVTALLTPDVYVDGTMYLYTPIVMLALLCNAIGKLLIITRTHYNFNFLVKPYPKYAGKIFTDKQNAEKMTHELPIRKPLIAYTRKARFMSNFLQLSYAPDPSEKSAARLAPYTSAFALVCGIVYGVMNRSFIGGISSFALTTAMSVPMMALLSINIPLRRLCKSALRSGAMITSYETVRQFSDTNAIMIDSSQLYPKGSVTLSGMRSFKQSKLNDALQAGAAIMNAVNGTMVHIFETIVQCSKNDLPRVDNVAYEDGKGIVGWVKDQRVLIGNRSLLSSHNITPPDPEIEEKYYKRGEDVLYISVGGDLIAMFILSYKTNKKVANELRALEQSGVSFIIRTVDPNITKEKAAERFGLFHRCITILPTGLGNICHDAMNGTEERSRAYLVTRGNISSFAKAVAGCLKMKLSVTLSNIFQWLSVGSGLMIVTMMSFVGGFEKLGCLEMLLFTGFWLLSSVIVSLIKR